MLLSSSLDSMDSWMVFCLAAQEISAGIRIKLTILQAYILMEESPISD
jgi:hypothetical protein